MSMARAACRAALACGLAVALTLGGAAALAEEGAEAAPPGEAEVGEAATSEVAGADPGTAEAGLAGAGFGEGGAEAVASEAQAEGADADDARAVSLSVPQGVSAGSTEAAASGGDSVVESRSGEDDVAGESGEPVGAQTADEGDGAGDVSDVADAQSDGQLVSAVVLAEDPGESAASAEAQAGTQAASAASAEAQAVAEGEETVPYTYEIKEEGLLKEPKAHLTLPAGSGVTDFVVPAEVEGAPVVSVVATGAGLSSIDVSACASTLYRLDVSDNALTSLDLAGCSSLLYLDCSGNELTELDCSSDDTFQMSELDCSDNALTSLDLSGLVLLEKLDCSGNRLTSLAAKIRPGTNNPGIDCSDNLLESLEVTSSATSDYPYRLDCSGNRLTELDLSHFATLYYLDCSDNELTELNLALASGVSDGYGDDLCMLDASNSDVAQRWYNVLHSGNLVFYLDASDNCLTDTGVIDTWLAASEYHSGSSANQRVAQDAAPTSFTDVASSAWYADWVTKAAAAGLMTGMKGADGAYTGEFAPESTLTRAQVATVLYRLGTGSTGDADAPEATSFSDTKGHWAAGAIEWCYEQGVVTGDAGKGTFRPDDPVSRQELATMVGRYAEKVAGVDVSGADASAYNKCTDAGKEASYATAYLKWTAAEGILSGKDVDGKKVIDATDGATRAQAAKVFVVLSDVVD